MKKIIALVLAAVMSMSCLVACAGPSEELQAAADYVKVLYQNEPEVTASDYTRATRTKYGNEFYDIEWKVDTDNVKIVAVDDKEVKMDVNNKTDVEIPYTLTAVVTDGKQKVEVKFNYKIPVYVGYEAIVDELYALESGKTLGDGALYTIEGTVISIETAYLDSNKYICVYMVAYGREDKPVLAYKLKDGSATGSASIQIGDEITVKGKLKNYNNDKYEFDTCTLEGIEKSTSSAKVYDNASELIAAAEALNLRHGIAGEQTLTGTIVSFTDKYTGGTDYKNAAFTIKVGDKEIGVYRIGVANDADLDKLQGLEIGDTVTVKGHIYKYKENVIQFVQGCTLENVVSSGNAEPEPEPAVPTVPAGATMAQIVDILYTLEKGQTLEGKYTLTGVISKIDTPYSESYGNITVSIVVAGKEDKPVICFRLKGDGADTLAVGDTISVTGTLMRYSDGKYEFGSGCTFTK